MFQRFILIAIIFTVFTAKTYTQSSGFGAGILLGEPVGISLKNWVSKTSAWDAGIAWGFGKPGTFHLHSDYIWHSFDLIEINKGKIPLSYGIGTRILFAGISHLGVRGVVGLNYIFEEYPLDIFLEIVPTFDFLPGTEISLNGGMGIRYFL